MKRERIELDSPDTVLGQLQRGQGRGYLAAREAKDVDALLHCIHFDPRWDRQVEQREMYYARLAIELDVRVSDIASRFDEDDELNLTAEVLVELGERGVPEAFGALRAALRSPNWRAAARALNFAQMDSDEPLVNKADLSALVDHDELRELVWKTAEWRMWAEMEPRLQPMLRQDAGPAETKARRQAAPKPDTSMSTEELLSIVCRENLKRVSNVLTQRRDGRSLNALRTAGKSGTEFQRIAALTVFGRHGDASLLESCIVQIQSDPMSMIRTVILRYLSALPAEHTLPVARRSFGQPKLAGIAASRILAQHAEAEDREAVEAQLLSFVEQEHLYGVSNMAGALGVIGSSDSTEILKRTFETVPYAYVRQHLIHALHICAPAQAVELAPDALFDSDDATRLWATQHTRRDLTTQERLVEMAEDEFEWGYIREAATKRPDDSDL